MALSIAWHIVRKNTMHLSELERCFINQYQGGFPLVGHPFKTVAEQLNTSEDTLVDTITGLLDKGLLSRFGPLYDAVQLGGGLTLAALSVPEDRYEIISRLVNTYPEVAHNYRREHELNMWFVLATETPENIETTIASIEQSTGLKVYNFPKQEEFYIGLWLDIAKDGSVSTIPVPSTQASSNPDYMIDELDRKIISVTQTGFPVNSIPYQTIANSIGTSPDEVITRLENMLASGIIRRIGAVPNHYRLGLKANGMTVWDVPDEQAQTLGKVIGQLDYVSHCYIRPRHLPVWRYNLFAMVHGHTRDEANEKVKQIETLLGDNCNAHETLFSSAILKKTGMQLAA